MSSEQSRLMSDGRVTVANNINQSLLADEQLSSESEDEVVALTAPHIYYSPRSPLPPSPEPEPEPIENESSLDSGEESDNEMGNEEVYESMLEENINACLDAQDCLQNTSDIVKRYKVTRQRLQGIEKKLRATHQETRAACAKFKSLKNDFLNKELCKYSNYIGRVLKLPSDDLTHGSGASQSQPTRNSIIQCGVCYEITNDNLYGLIPCGHTICSDCFDGFFTRGHSSCPYCRARVYSSLKLFV